MTTEQDVGKGAAIAIGAAAAACSVVPGIGTAFCGAAAAIASAFTALGVAISSGLRDTYHPGAATALSWLTVWQFIPGALWTDNDTLQLDGFHNGANLVHPRTGTPAEDACRLVRYSLVLAGLAHPSSPLYNPGDRGESGKDANPYIEAPKPDPHHPLTDRDFVQKIWTQAKAQGVCSFKIPSLIHTKAEAIDALAALRSPHFDAGIFTNWKQLGACLPALRHQVIEARKLAGEVGPDPKLDAMLGGSVTVRTAKGRAASKTDHRTGGGFSEGLGFGLGLLPGLFLGGSLVAVGLAVYNSTRKAG